MAAVFYVIGGLGLVFGLGWAGLVLNQPTMDGANPGVLTLARIIAVMPGLSVAGGGLLFMAIGGVLDRLDRIARYARRAALSLETMLKPDAR